MNVFVKPIIIFNQDGYYDPLIEMMERCISENFMHDKHRKIWSVVDHPSQIIEAIETAPHWDRTAISFAVV